MPKDFTSGAVRKLSIPEAIVLIASIATVFGVIVAVLQLSQSISGGWEQEKFQATSVAQQLQAQAKIADFLEKQLAVQSQLATLQASGSNIPATGTAVAKIEAQLRSTEEALKSSLANIAATATAIAVSQPPSKQPTIIPTAVTASTPRVLYPPVKPREPKDEQDIHDYKIVFEWEHLQQVQAPGNFYQVFYKSVGNPNWEFTTDKVGMDACARGICSSKAVRYNEDWIDANSGNLVFSRGYGEYMWTVFVVDASGTRVSQQGVERRFKWGE